MYYWYFWQIKWKNVEKSVDNPSVVKKEITVETISKPNEIVWWAYMSESKFLIRGYAVLCIYKTGIKKRNELVDIKYEIGIES